MTFSGVLSRETELAVQTEATYGVSPGALAGTNFFKHHVWPGMAKRTNEMFLRDNEANQAQGDILSLQLGRKEASESFEVDLIPNGTTTGPTAPDIDQFLVAAMGTKHAATAHTTTGNGTSGTSLVLTAGGGAASGITAGDLFAVDLDGTPTYEIRQCVSIITDTITMDRALTSNPTSGKAVKVGVTYKLAWTPITTLFLWWFNYNNLRYQLPGCIVESIALDVKASDKTPIGVIKIGLKGQRQLSQSSTSRPTPSTNGVQLVPIPSKLWVGSNKYSYVDMSLSMKTGLALRNNESNQLYPDAAIRTGQKGYWDIELAITALTTDTWQTIYDSADTFTTQDILCQFGSAVGQMVGYRAQNWRPGADHADVGGEVAYKLAGRCLGVNGNDSLYLGFI